MKIRRLSILLPLFSVLLAARQAAGEEAQVVGIPEPESLSSTVDSPLYVDDQIVLERRQTRDIPTEGLENVLSVDPSIVSARPNGGNQLYIQGLSLGVTYVHLWTSHGRKTRTFLREDSE